MTNVYDVTNRMTHPPSYYDVTKLQKRELSLHQDKEAAAAPPPRLAAIITRGGNQRGEFPQVEDAKEENFPGPGKEEGAAQRLDQDAGGRQLGGVAGGGIPRS